jgi:hypothetical protein
MLDRRQKLLDAAMADFMADWRRLHRRFPDDFVPLRRIGVTGFVAWDLRRAGLIDIDGDSACPIDWEWRP